LTFLVRKDRRNVFINQKALKDYYLVKKVVRVEGWRLPDLFEELEGVAHNDLSNLLVGVPVFDHPTGDGLEAFSWIFHAFDVI